MTLYFIYLLISWSHSSFHLFNQKSEKTKKRKKKLQIIIKRVAAEVNSEVFLYCSFHALCCIVLFMETSTCTCAKRPIFKKVSLWTEQSACGGRDVCCRHSPAHFILKFHPKMVHSRFSFLSFFLKLRLQIFGHLGAAGQADNTTSATLYQRL